MGLSSLGNNGGSCFLVARLRGASAVRVDYAMATSIVADKTWRNVVVGYNTHTIWGVKPQ